MSQSNKLNLKALETRLNALQSENQALRERINSLEGTVEKLNSDMTSVKEEMFGLQQVVSENVERREAVELNLASVEKNYKHLEESQKKVVTAVEVQSQYSRKSTLILSGKCIPAYHDNENTTAVALNLLHIHLGLRLPPQALTACHRLKNRSVILVRFAYMADRMEAYNRRIKPCVQGLWVHESLTSERLAVVHLLQELQGKDKSQSPFQSHYTSMGRIFIKPHGASKAVELPVGTTKEEVLKICQTQGYMTVSASSKSDVPPRPPQNVPGPRRHPPPSGVHQGYHPSSAHPSQTMRWSTVARGSRLPPLPPPAQLAQPTMWDPLMETCPKTFVSTGRPEATLRPTEGDTNSATNEEVNSTSSLTIQ